MKKASYLYGAFLCLIPFNAFAGGGGDMFAFMIGGILLYTYLPIMVFIAFFIWLSTYYSKILGLVLLSAYSTVVLGFCFYSFIWYTQADIYIRIKIFLIVSIVSILPIFLVYKLSSKKL